MDNSKLAGFAHRLWHWFISPSPLIKEQDQRRQATLLSSLLFVIVVVSLIVEGISLSLYGAEIHFADQFALATTLVLAIIYSLSRTQYVQLAAILAVIAISLAVFVAGWIAPDWALAGLFDFIIIPLWLGSLYLSLHRLVILIISNLVVLLAIPILVPEVPLDYILLFPFGFLLTASFILVVITRHRNLLEQDRRVELMAKEQQSRREAERSAVLLRVAEHLNKQLDLDTLLKDISAEVAQVLNVRVSIVALFENKQNMLKPVAGVGLAPEAIQSLAPLPMALFDQIVMEYGTRYAVQNLQEIIGFPGLDRYTQLNLRSLAFSMMVYEQELIGSLNVFTVAETRQFTKDELLLLQGLADQAALAIVNTGLYNDARRRMDHLQALRAIDVAIVSNHDLRHMLDVLLEQITRQLRVDAAVILIFDREKQFLEHAASHGFQTPTLRYTRLRLGQGMAGRAAQQRKTIRINDLRTDPQTLIYAPSLSKEGFACYFAAPLIAKEQVTGVLEVFHRTSLDPDQEWLDFLETLAGQAAIAIESTSLFADLQKLNKELFNAYDSTIEGWSHALDLRDKETEGHTLRVTELTLEMARAFGFGEAELVHVRRGGLLHDIGKMGIPDRILLKEGPLTQEEWEIMRKHPVYAYEMLLPIEYLRPALDIPYCHHEKWDGSGYPRGLKGEEIPLIARIFAMVDVWDAVTSDRPYRSAWSTEKALAYIQEQSGTHFDPHVVEVFLALVEEKPDIFKIHPV